MDKPPSEFGPANPLFWELYQQGRYQEAIATAEQGLALAREQLGEEDPCLSALMNELSCAYLQAGDATQAETLLLQALDLVRPARDRYPRYYAACLHNLAHVYEMQGDLRRAAALRPEAVEILRREVGAEDPEFATYLNGLAGLYFRMGDFSRAEPEFKQVLKIRRATLGTDHPEYASILANLGELYRVMGDLELAVPLARKALEIERRTLGDRHPQLISSLNGLAELYLEQGNWQDAEPLVREAVVLSRLALGKNHAQHAVSLHNLGALHLAKGDPAKAHSLSVQALEIRRAALGEQHPDYAIGLNMLAFCELLMGDAARAESQLRRALEITRTALGDDHPEYALRLDNLAQVCAAEGRTDEAFELLGKVATIEDRMIGQVFSLASERQRMRYLAKIVDDTAEFLSLVWQDAASPHNVSQAFDLVLRRKAISAEALAVQRLAVLGGRYPSLRRRLHDLATLRETIAQVTLDGARSDKLDDRGMLAKWEAEREWIEAELARQIPEMNLEQQLRVADRWGVAKALPENSALVEFVHFNVFDFHAVPRRLSETCWRSPQKWQPSRYLAFVLLADEPDNVQMIDVGAAEVIDQLVAEFRADVSRPSPPRERSLMPDRDRSASPTAGARLREMVFDPLRAALAQRTRLLIAPDGQLNLLPFEVLPTGDGRRVIDEYQISHLSCGRDALRFGIQAIKEPSAPLVVADPNYDLQGEEAMASTEPADRAPRRSFDPARGQFAIAPAGRLPGTLREGEAIAGLLRKARLWAGDEALEGRLKEECGSPRVLHMATHGYFLPRPELEAVGLQNPLLRSWLVLAGFNTWLRQGPPAPRAEDGILTAEDVTGLDLLDTDLVVLSACETGLGDVYPGEGVFGLRRAFALAGAKTLVISLWKVPDRQTLELMETFYRRLLTGEPRAEALRQAQLTLKARYPHPFYWGAFICQGEPAPLSVPTALTSPGTADLR